MLAPQAALPLVMATAHRDALVDAVLDVPMDAVVLVVQTARPHVMEFVPAVVLTFVALLVPAAAVVIVLVDAVLLAHQDVGEPAVVGVVGVVTNLGVQQPVLLLAVIAQANALVLVPEHVVTSVDAQVIDAPAVASAEAVVEHVPVIVLVDALTAAYLDVLQIVLVGVVQHVR